MLAGAAAFVATDLIAKALAEAHLPGTVVDLKVLQLQLAHNSGVAFSLGAHLPSWTVIAATAAITLVLAAYAWRAAPTASRPQRLAGAAILGGASANLIDRIGDGVVTDYLHTGWWPTFNLADTLLMLGMATVILTMLRDPAPGPRPAQTHGGRGHHHTMNQLVHTIAGTATAHCWPCPPAAAATRDTGTCHRP